MTVTEGVHWMLIAILVLVVWDQNRTIWRLLDVLKGAVDVMETMQREPGEPE